MSRMQTMTIGLIILTCLCLAPWGALATPDTTEVYEYVLSWGGHGSGPGEFNGLNRMGSDQYGNLYVGDRGNFRVQKFDSLGNFLMMFGEYGEEPGQFVGPRDVTVDEDGYIYVGDYDTHDWDPSWVHKFDSLGNFVLRWGGEAGLEPGQLYAPLGVAVGDSGYIFVADQGHRIQRFTPDGELDLFWTHPDSAHGGDVVGTYPGSVYTEWATGEDYLFRHDPMGNIILSFASGGEVGYPKDLATDTAGNLYVTDWWNKRVVKFDSLGNFITMWGEVGPEPWQFGTVTGIAVDLHGAVYISDAVQDRVHKYRRTIVRVEGETIEEFRRPFGIRLAQNYPNPFVTTTTIAYFVPRVAWVSMSIYDIRGALVRTVVSEEQRAGRHQVDWDGRDQRGHRVGSGIYFCHLLVDGQAETKRMVLLR